MLCGHVTVKSDLRQSNFEAHQAGVQAGVRSFIIIFDVYVILDTFEKYDNKRADPICRMTPYAAKPSERIQEIIK